MRTRNRGLWIFVTASLLWTGCSTGSSQQAAQPAHEKAAPDKSIAEAAPVSDTSPNAGSDAQPAANESFDLQAGSSATVAVTPANESTEPQAAPTADVTIVMENCKASRPGKITADTSILKMVFSGPPQDKLVKRGTVQVDGQDYTLYLPKSESYSTKNTGEGDSGFENTSTLISVDHNRDGKLTDDEGWFANLPLRLGDKMFDVAEIAQDGGKIVLKPSQSPIRGVIVGRTCPPFSYKTADGDEVGLESLAGKAFILDIWSFT
jgi:hypothetical protein